MDILNTFEWAQINVIYIYIPTFGNVQAIVAGGFDTTSQCKVTVVPTDTNCVLGPIIISGFASIIKYRHDFNSNPSSET